MSLKSKAAQPRKSAPPRPNRVLKGAAEGILTAIVPAPASQRKTFTSAPSPSTAVAPAPASRRKSSIAAPFPSGHERQRSHRSSRTEGSSASVPSAHSAHSVGRRRSSALSPTVASSIASIIPIAHLPSELNSSGRSVSSQGSKSNASSQGRRSEVSSHGRGSQVSPPGRRSNISPQARRSNAGAHGQRRKSSLVMSDSPRILSKSGRIGKENDGSFGNMSHETMTLPRDTLKVTATLPPVDTSSPPPEPPKPKGLTLVLRRGEGRGDTTRTLPRMPSDYMELQQMFAMLFPEGNRLLLSVERDSGLPLPPASPGFLPGEAIVFREFRPPERERHLGLDLRRFRPLVGKYLDLLEAEYVTRLPRRVVFDKPSR